MPQPYPYATPPPPHKAQSEGEWWTITASHQSLLSRESTISWIVQEHSKAIPNKLIDSHPNFRKKWGGWVDFIFYFLIFMENINQSKTW